MCVYENLKGVSRGCGNLVAQFLPQTETEREGWSERHIVACLLLRVQVPYLGLFSGEQVDRLKVSVDIL